MDGMTPSDHFTRLADQLGEVVEGSSAADLTLHLAPLDRFSRRHLADRGVAPLVEHAPVPECPRHGFHRRSTGLHRESRLSAILRRHYHRLPSLAAAPPLSAPGRLAAGSQPFSNLHG
jgi:hypothetical protein